MSQTSSTARRGPERRQAIWPWVVMPLVALALFLTLRTVRHSGAIGQSDVPSLSGAPAQ